MNTVEIKSITGFEENDFVKITNKDAPTKKPDVTLNARIASVCPNNFQYELSVENNTEGQIGSPIPESDSELNSSFDLDLVKLNLEKGSVVELIIHIDEKNEISETIFDKKFVFTSTKTNRKRVFLKGDYSPKTASLLFIIGKNPKMDPVSFNIHFISKVGEKENVWAFDPKVRNEG